MPLEAFSIGLAGAMFNAGMLVANMCFTRAEQIAKYDMALFSKQGQFCTLLWGAAYAAVAFDGKNSGQVGKYVWLVFTLEKAYYVLHWARWHMKNDVGKMWKTATGSGDPLAILTPVFYSTYGLGDAVFAALYATLFLQG
mmetsp:Transcript_23465/g.51471  ORF Transcript_23465/g.51471 Transcript_23465/m.51471 type:complete len:140 (-) Transcript_23465:45-464(-)|eukprot:CAMPEP_0206477508 /NCGR_PEP_ID=MMETSP0324_2-20121206/35424_1 /ASSEMBLY_ACC=CAM_ASM_000836 /TAXON_ID=2866 /ORGANISM="Crypthecodinium cohnii, Strain Seligo" /LENGTH=139 /DNA_ID=CAMNT_0053953485 /DNA_START=120 /DNA_END=539 /DNA_ORIENTATION=-